MGIRKVRKHAVTRTKLVVTAAGETKISVHYSAPNLTSLGTMGKRLEAREGTGTTLSRGSRVYGTRLRYRGARVLVTIGRAVE